MYAVRSVHSLSAPFDIQRYDVLLRGVVPQLKCIVQHGKVVQACSGNDTSQPCCCQLEKDIIFKTQYVCIR